ncbi:MAG: DUF2062 domain-containing protein [Candidatus Rokubacteria bacterium]|nr:DUF2062 domain-containing protein [Candidatus Rokubacteria bacterium]
MKVARLRLRDRLHALLQLDDPPWRTALALALGVFIGCTPFWFFQTVMALVLATVFRLNRVTTVTGAWLNLPWVAPFVYGAALKIGTLIVPGHDAAAAETVRLLLGGHDAFDWEEALGLLRETSIALLAGTTIVGVIAAAITYVVALRVLTARGARGRNGERARGRSRAA